MTPLRVTARLDGSVCFTDRPPGLDALIAYASASRDGMIDGRRAHEMVPIEIPIAREPGGRFHLASIGQCDAECAGLKDWTNRRFPIPEAQEFAIAKFTRINISAGAQKSYRLPRERTHLTSDRMDFFCIGDADAIDDLLVHIDYLGKRRAVGLGRVRQWEIEPCEPWGDEFPVARDGRPLRPLPLDWPGLAPDVDVAFSAMSYPYWDRSKEREMAVPRWDR